MIEGANGRGITANRAVLARVLAGVVLGAAATLGCSGQGRGTVLPEIVERFPEGTAVRVTSSDAALQRLLTTAFTTHGAFDPAAPQPQIQIQVEPAGATSADLKILSINPPQALFGQRVNGADRTDAALRAADLAVLRQTKTPGFFAGHIAFVFGSGATSEIGTSDLFFEAAKKRTAHGSLCVGPTWSPRGGSLLYTSYHGTGFPDIFRYDMSTRRVAVFASFRGTNTGAAFNPGGNRVAMVLSGSGNPELYTGNAAGRDIRRLTRTPGLESGPTWSPDGRKIVFSSTGRGGGPQLYEMAGTGGTMRRLPTNISGNCTEPDWNPVHPEQIAFTALMGREFEVALYTYGGAARVLTGGRGDAIEPCWTNDGRHLIYTRRTGSQKQLMVLDTRSRQSPPRAVPLNHSNVGSAWQADFFYPGR